MPMKSATVIQEVPAVMNPARPRLHRATVIFSFLSIYLIWGSTYLAIRYAVETIPPLYTAGLRHLVAGTILLVWCLAKRLRPTWAQVRASIIIGVFHRPRHASLGRAKSTVWPCLSPHCQRAHLGFPAYRYRRPAMALERNASGWNSSGIRRRRPPDGPKRPEFRPGRVRRFARRLARRVFLVRGDCLLPAVASLRASTSLVGTFIAGGFRATAPRRNGCGGISRFFLRVRLLTFVARARLSHSLRLGRGLHRLQLAPRALLSHARRHPHLRQSHRCGLARVALRRRGRHVKRAPLHRPCHWRGHARRSRHGAPSAGLLEFGH